MPDYIPAADAEFDAWMTNFHTYASANLAGLGLVAGDLTPITTARTTWQTAYPAHNTAQANAQAAKQTKDGARSALVGLVRPLALDMPRRAARDRLRGKRRALPGTACQGLVRRLQASPSVDDTERAALGIAVPDPGGPIPPPTTRPLAIIECKRLQHTVGFVDESTPTKKAKPPGVIGAEIWLALLPVGSPAPTDPADYDFVALDTKTPYTLDPGHEYASRAGFDGADGGKNAHYLLRWANATGERGPWSETVSVTVGA